MRSRQLQLSMNILLAAVIAGSCALQAQQPPAPEKPRTEATNPNPPASGAASAPETKPADSTKAAPRAETISPSARLAGARSVFLKRTGGSDIPYAVIGDSIQGWGRFVVVNAPEKADLILEVEAPEDTSGLTIGSSTRATSASGEPDRSSSTWLSKQNPGGDVKLIVHDARTGNVLWRAVEQAKSSLKKTSRENSLVEAAERLFVKFHDRIEPPPAMTR
jgi:hypothetical protein